MGSFKPANMVSARLLQAFGEARELPATVQNGILVLIREVDPDLGEQLSDRVLLLDEEIKMINEENSK